MSAIGNFILFNPSRPVLRLWHLRCLLVFLLLLPVSDIRAQGYSYAHYTSRDGLANAVVYCMAQDVDGFMWFGTETGVSRFDGSQFKTFTVKDGLPDNAILRLFADSKGRVWIMPFKNTICYYYKGKIYNQQNDSLLSKIKLTDFAMGAVETSRGDVLLLDKKKIYRISPDDQMFTTDCPGTECTMGKLVCEPGEILVLDENQVYAADEELKNFRFVRKLTPQKSGEGQAVIGRDLICWVRSLNHMHVESMRYNVKYDLQVPSVNSIRKANDSLISINTNSGSLLFNIRTKKMDEHFLPNKNVSNYFLDNEGGTWFTTLKDGVYRIHSRLIKNFRTYGGGAQKISVYDLESDGNDVLLGTDMGCLRLKKEKDGYTLIEEDSYRLPFEKPVNSISVMDNRKVICSGPHVFWNEDNGPVRYMNNFGAVKQTAFLNKDELLIATSATLYTYRISTNKLLPGHYQGRTTSLLVRNDSAWFGTLEGLYMMKPDKSLEFFGNRLPILGKRVAAISEGRDGTIWVAVDGGVVGLKNNKAEYIFTLANGLGSDDCRSLASDENSIWIGTDNGLHRAFTDGSGRLMRYTTANGLGSNMVNAVLIKGNHVMAGTPEGLSWFDKRSVIPQSRCDLRLLGISINGESVKQAPSYSISYDKRNLRLDYVGISYGSEGDIQYSYRLKGFDTAWKTTRQNALDFIALPAGTYQLELFATNRLGVVSQLVEIGLVIQSPFWLSTWFIVLGALLIIFLTWLIVTKWNKREKKKEAAKRSIQERLQELEQKALRAQMNPHFIFNSLNSIQGFIMDNDADSANKYLSNFARLIRQTLDNSMHPMISIEDEIRYLDSYLLLEQLRFKNRFSYEIIAEETVDPAQHFIPGMVLQPFVENSIRHGIQNREGDGGNVSIRFSERGGYLICTISDNGPGRVAAQSLKTKQHIEYQSRGIQLTTERISILNMQAHQQISVEIEDLDDEKGRTAGTKVSIRFPVI